MKQGDYIIGIQQERNSGNNKKHKNCSTKNKRKPKKSFSKDQRLVKSLKQGDDKL